MRLDVVKRGHKLPQKLMLTIIRAVSGDEPPDVIKTLLYRPEFFGKHFSASVQEALRGPSDWSVGERELFASYTAKLNHCLF